MSSNSERTVSGHLQKWARFSFLGIVVSTLSIKSKKKKKKKKKKRQKDRIKHNSSGSENGFFL